MTECEHCQTIRHAHAAVMQRHDITSLPHWGHHPGLDAYIDEGTRAACTANRRTDMAGCPCQCHIPARIAGGLPRLVPAR